MELSGSRIWMILALTFIAISVALTVYLIVNEVKDSDSGKPSEDEIVQNYPNYFRTVEEQEIVAKTYEEVILTENQTVVPIDQVYPAEKCSFQCNKTFGGKPARRRRSAPLDPQFWPGDRHNGQQLDMMKGGQVYSEQRSKRQAQWGHRVRHGCCISTFSFADPEEATTLEGEEVTVVQFTTRRQYFPSEICRHAQGCTGCRCGHQPSFTSAVIKVGDDVKVGLIVLEGFCKCFNT